MKKRSISIDGHRTSIALEEPFWHELEKAATQAGLSVPALIAKIDKDRLSQSPMPGLASCLRVFVLRCAQKGHVDNSGAPVD